MTRIRAAAPFAAALSAALCAACAGPQTPQTPRDAGLQETPVAAVAPQRRATYRQDLSASYYRILTPEERALRQAFVDARFAVDRRDPQSRADGIDTPVAAHERPATLAETKLLLGILFPPLAPVVLIMQPGS